jgi:hypothetical protein
MNKISARIDILIARRRTINELICGLIKAHEWTAIDVAKAHYDALTADIDELLEMMKDLGPAMHEATDADIDARLAAA